MATWYISPSGNDTTGNGSLELPWLTLNKSNTMSSNGDTVIVLPGTYTLGNNYNANFTKNATWVGQSPLTTIFDGTGSTGIYFTFGGSGSPTLSGIQFKNIDTASGEGVFGIASSNQTITLNNCIFSGLTHSIGYRIFEGYLPTNLIFNSCVFIDNLVVPLVHIYGNPSTLSLTNCIVYSSVSAASQISSIIYSSAGVIYTIKNNLFQCTSGTAMAFRRGTSGSWTTSNNCWSGVTQLVGSGDVVADPLFWDAANGDFRLRSKDGSGNPNPVIEAGVML